MKALIGLKNVWYTVVLFLFSIVLYAQDKKVDVDIDVGKHDGGNWYAHPVAWVIGAAIFILLLVALLRGKK
jgi:hypothetical protein